MLILIPPVRPALRQRELSGNFFDRLILGIAAFWLLEIPERQRKKPLPNGTFGWTFETKLSASEVFDVRQV